MKFWSGFIETMLLPNKSWDEVVLGKCVI
jgi:hypothetical protein